MQAGVFEDIVLDFLIRCLGLCSGYIQLRHTVMELMLPALVLSRILNNPFTCSSYMSKQKPHLTRLIGVEVDDDEEVSIMCDQETG